MGVLENLVPGKFELPFGMGKGFLSGVNKGRREKPDAVVTAIPLPEEAESLQDERVFPPGYTEFNNNIRAAFNETVDGTMQPKWTVFMITEHNAKVPLTYDEVAGSEHSFVFQMDRLLDVYQHLSDAQRQASDAFNVTYEEEHGNFHITVLAGDEVLNLYLEDNVPAYEAQRALQEEERKAQEQQALERVKQQYPESEHWHLVTVEDFLTHIEKDRHKSYWSLLPNDRGTRITDPQLKASIRELGGVEYVAYQYVNKAYNEADRTPSPLNRLTEDLQLQIIVGNVQLQNTSEPFRVRHTYVLDLVDPVTDEVLEDEDDDMDEEYEDDEIDVLDDENDDEYAPAAIQRRAYDRDLLASVLTGPNFAPPVFAVDRRGRKKQLKTKLPVVMIEGPLATEITATDYRDILTQINTMATGFDNPMMAYNETPEGIPYIDIYDGDSLLQSKYIRIIRKRTEADLSADERSQRELKKADGKWLGELGKTSPQNTKEQLRVDTTYLATANRDGEIDDAEKAVIKKMVERRLKYGADMVWKLACDSLKDADLTTPQGLVRVYELSFQFLDRQEQEIVNANNEPAGVIKHVRSEVLRIWGFSFEVSKEAGRFKGLDIEIMFAKTRELIEKKMLEAARSLIDANYRNHMNGWLQNLDSRTLALAFPQLRVSEMVLQRQRDGLNLFAKVAKERFLITSPELIQLLQSIFGVPAETFGEEYQAHELNTQQVERAVAWEGAPSEYKFIRRKILRYAAENSMANGVPDNVDLFPLNQSLLNNRFMYDLVLQVGRDLDKNRKAQYIPVFTKAELAELAKMLPARQDFSSKYKTTSALQSLELADVQRQQRANEEAKTKKQVKPLVIEEEQRNDLERVYKLMTGDGRSIRAVLAEIREREKAKKRDPGALSPVAFVQAALQYEQQAVIDPTIEFARTLVAALPEELQQKYTFDQFIAAPASTVVDAKRATQTQETSPVVVEVAPQAVEVQQNTQLIGVNSPEYNAFAGMIDGVGPERLRGVFEWALTRFGTAAELAPDFIPVVEAAAGRLSLEDLSYFYEVFDDVADEANDPKFENQLIDVAAAIEKAMKKLSENLKPTGNEETDTLIVVSYVQTHDSSSDDKVRKNLTKRGFALTMVDEVLAMYAPVESAYVPEAPTTLTPDMIAQLRAYSAEQAKARAQTDIAVTESKNSERNKK